MDNRKNMPIHSYGRNHACPYSHPHTHMYVEPRNNVGRSDMAKTCCGVMPECAALAMAYVPMQVFEELYAAEVGFDRGTVFKQLDLPYLGTPLCDEEECCHD